MCLMEAHLAHLACSKYNDIFAVFRQVFTLIGHDHRNCYRGTKLKNQQNLWFMYFYIFVLHCFLNFNQCGCFLNFIITINNFCKSLFLLIIRFEPASHRTLIYVAYLHWSTGWPRKTEVVWIPYNFLFKTYFLNFVFLKYSKFIGNILR